MKKILSMLSVLSLSSTSIAGSTILTNINSNVKINNNNYDLQEMEIKSPVPTKSFLTTAGDWGTNRREWAYTTINLGKMKQEQIMGIGSTNNDSYTEHKVADYDYHKIDNTAGIHHGPNFRNYFLQDKVTSNWRYENALANSKINFNSSVKIFLAEHWAIGTIKFLWHYNDNSDLLIQIVGTLNVGAYWTSTKGIASIKLGSWFTIYYNYTN